MRYARINKTDIANGPGVRVSLFVSGCRRHCRGCFNAEAWNFNYGDLFTAMTIEDIVEAVAPDHIEGLSILGGEPLEPENALGLFELCRRVKEQYPNKSIWIYSGYTYDEIRDFPIMRFVDVLVDGPFIEAEKDITLKFRGSRNQRLIDVVASQYAGKAIILEV